MDDRLLESSAREFEQEVANLFESLRSQPCVLCEIPVIGWVHGYEYSPRAPRQETAVLERLVVKALCARKWFELYEAPPWAPKLPLSLKELEACAQSGGRRPRLIGRYGWHLRALQWEYRNARPFELFCADKLGG
jgi:hypothetical protein